MNRRELLRGVPWLMGTGLGVGLASLPACQQPMPPLKVSSHVWVGYELLFLARELGLFKETEIRLVEVPTNTASMMALSNREVGMAALTLDEFLLAREGGVDVKAVLVFDESAGADAVLVKPHIQRLADLKGKRIGVESTAVGALMLAKLLESASLSLTDVQKIEVMLDRHVDAFQQGEVDAIITFEPMAQQVRAVGGVTLLDSSQFPGLIVDVLVAYGDVLSQYPQASRQLLNGYFGAAAYMRDKPQEAARLMAPRLRLSVEEVISAFEGIRIPDVVHNQRWLGGHTPNLIKAARTVGDILLQSHLLRSPPTLSALCDPAFLPESV